MVEVAEFEFAIDLAYLLVVIAVGAEEGLGVRLSENVWVPVTITLLLDRCVYKG